jgi:ATP-dependent HslUV protease subunit HslV
MQRENRGARTRSTTILALRHKDQLVIAGDGQVTLGDTVIKAKAHKVRQLLDGKVVAGFAGSAADGMTLFDRFEAKLKEYSGNLTRAVVELAKDWRTDKVLRRLEALLVVADRERIFLLSGTGDVIEPDCGAVGIGSGGNYALAAARALMRHTELSAREIAEQSMAIAAELCVYTNENLTIEELS